MTRLPRITSKQVVGVLKKKGFEPVHGRGSHRTFHSPNGRTVTVPIHAGRILRPGTLQSILKQTGISMEELVELLWC